MKRLAENARKMTLADLKTKRKVLARKLVKSLVEEYDGVSRVETLGEKCEKNDLG